MFDDAKEFLDAEFFGNHLYDYLLAVLIFLIITVVIRIGVRLLLNRLNQFIKRTGNTYIVALSDAIYKRALPIIHTVSIFTALQYLTLSSIVERYIHHAVIVIVSMYLVFFITDLIKRYLGEIGIKGRILPAGIITMLKVIVWLIAVLSVLSNFGYNVTTFVAGLGIGGVAIALASQSILGDLFNYFVILFDKPFAVGDFIQVDDKMGEIEFIGIKSTRIRSATGEQLLISNTDLTKSRIHNFKVMKRRRAVAKLGVVYNTELQLLKSIPELLKGIVVANKRCEFARVHFAEFGAYALNFELVYFVDSNDMVEYAKVVQEVNFAIAESFDKEKISFAYPTSMVYIEK